MAEEPAAVPASYPSSLTEMMAAMQLQPDLPSGASWSADAFITLSLLQYPLLWL